MTRFEEIEKERQSKERREYVAFMENPKNIRNCNECPNRMDDPGWEMPLPCGQQNCWVALHCYSR